MLEKWLRELDTRLAELRVDVFDSPPKTMEEFRERFGRYQEAKSARDKLYRIVAGLEDGDSNE